MPPIHVFVTQIIRALWLVWLVIWLVGAFLNKRTVYRQPWPQRLVYLLVVACGFAVARVMDHPFVPLIPLTPLSDLLGLTLCAAGLGWSIWARLVLGRNWSGMVTLKENHELIQTGPYAITRHPIYTGILAALVGTVGALFPTRLGALWLTMLMIGFAIKLRQEESLMLRQFPDAYPAYKARVRGALVPYVL